MEQKKNYGIIKKSILDILNDGEEHSVDEIQKIIKETQNIDVTKKHLQTSICQLSDNQEPIERVGRGIYRLRRKQDEDNANEEIGSEKIIEICQKWQELLEQKLNYNLSDEVYSQYRRIHQLNDKYLNELKYITQQNAI